MDSKKQDTGVPRLLQDSDFPSGIIKPRMLAASTTQATGDLYYVNSQGIFARLPAGSATTFLKVSGGIPTWSSLGNVPSSSVTPSSATYTPGAGGTATLDLSSATGSNDLRITMPAGNITIALSGPQTSQKFIISITQDGVGSRTVTWFTTIRWVSGGIAPVLTTTASKRDVFGFIQTGAGTYDGFVVGSNI